METVVGCCGARSKTWPKATQLCTNLIQIPWHLLLNANHISPDIKTNCQSDTTAVKVRPKHGFLQHTKYSHVKRQISEVLPNSPKSNVKFVHTW